MENTCLIVFLKLLYGLFMKKNFCMTHDVFFINEQNLVVADPRFKEIDEGFSDLQLGQASVPNH